MKGKFEDYQGKFRALKDMAMLYTVVVFIVED